MIDQHIIDNIIDANPIERVVGEYISLKRAGANHKAVCPFHADSNASLMVSPSKGIFKCFGCGEGGNAISFVTKYEGISFPEAAEKLAARANITIPKPELKPEEQRARLHREGMTIALTTARDTYVSARAEKDAAKWLASRNIPAEILDAYQTGYAPSEGKILRELAAKKGISKEMLEATGLIGKSEKGFEFERFRGRIVWPFYTPNGRIIGFTGRAIDGSEIKYMNSPETELFNKGKTLFGIYQAKRDIMLRDEVYLVEGQFDVMRMAAIGCPNTVCGSGTALSEDQVQLLKRYTDNVTLIYDADEAGLKASRRSAELLLAAGMSVSAISLPAGEDPDSYFATLPDKKIKNVLDSKQNIVSYLYAARASEKSDPNLTADLIDSLSQLIAIIPDGIRAGLMIKELGKLSKTSASDITDLVRQYRDKRPKMEIALPDNVSLVGMPELKELLQGKSQRVEITWSLDRYQDLWQAAPVLLVNGQPGLAEVQELRLLADSLTTRVDIRVGEDLEEPLELKTMQSLARQGFDITILQEINRYEAIEDEDGNTSRELKTGLIELGWTEYYISLYSDFKGANENVRKTVLQRCAEEISYADPTTYSANITNYARELGITKTALTDIVAPYKSARKSEYQARTNTIEDEDGNVINLNMSELPDYVVDDEDLHRMYTRFGFFPLMNKSKTRKVGYVFGKQGSFQRVGNFYIEPLIHVKHDKSEQNRRIVELSVANRPGKSYMEFISKDMLSLTTFEQRMWERGNLCFSNGKQEYLRSIIYAQADCYRECTELQTYGWSDRGFFAFANGFYHEVDGEFKFSAVDNIGLVSHGDASYYLPTFSRIQLDKAEEESEADRQSKFLKYDPDKQAPIDILQWGKLMDEVYKINDNGKWGIIYAIMSAFRSDIFEIDRLFTALFFVGPTNSGKSKIAYSVRALYMPEEAPYFNLNLGTHPALSSLLERYRNIPVMLDEYNDTEIQDVIFQSLKAAVYDGEGRQKRKSADTKDIETTKVNAPIILLGQESPQKDDGSLANRCIICDVPLKGEWTEEEKAIFTELKEHEAAGLHHLLFHVLAIRPQIKEHYRTTQQACVRELSAAVRGQLANCEALPRVLNTVSIFLAVCKIVLEHTQLQLPFTYEEFFTLATEKVIKQVESLSNTNKINLFFSSIDVLINEGKVVPGRDYKIAHPSGSAVTVVKAGREKESVVVDPGTRLLYLQVPALYPHYQRLIGKDALSLASLQKYMESTQFYIGRSQNTKFSWSEAQDRSQVDIRKEEVNPLAGQPMHKDSHPSDNVMVRVMVRVDKVTSCVIFDYNKLSSALGIDIDRNFGSDETNDEPEMF